MHRTEQAYAVASKKKKGPLDRGGLPLRLIERLSTRQRPPSEEREMPRGRVQQSRRSSSPRLRALFRRPSRSGCSLRNLPLAVRRGMIFCPSPPLLIGFSPKAIRPACGEAASGADFADRPAKAGQGTEREETNGERQALPFERLVSGRVGP